jgi:hypothetical protein
VYRYTQRREELLLWALTGAREYRDYVHSTFRNTVLFKREKLLSVNVWTDIYIYVMLNLIPFDGGMVDPPLTDFPTLFY